MAAPEDNGPRRLEVMTDGLVLYSAPATDADTRTEFPRSAVLSNLGCAAVSGEVWCKVIPLRGGNEGYVQAAYLQPAKGPDGIIPTGTDTSKQRARANDFDATSTISCAQEQGQALGQCRAAIARSGGGDATVFVTFQNGFTRHLFFTHGQFMRANATMSGVGTDTDWQLIGDTYTIRVDDQRYEMPKAFLLGK
ncbi:SH3 domain-containing protein [Roseobacter sp. YSTF-M11]|uniref:SH3 domain-containing protein n=1 Tax=Roseobacter insulae TaxID=2859783 RepID=A0A9X1K3U3_9RHOB|nr:SH3 domain-containing protein [Roseobacter insulae]MBW4709017.1 SH3 domain-containing protein [Roseobacter insulae]